MAAAKTHGVINENVGIKENDVTKMVSGHGGESMAA